MADMQIAFSEQGQKWPHVYFSSAIEFVMELVEFSTDILSAENLSPAFSGLKLGASLHLMFWLVITEFQAVYKHFL